MAQLLIAGLILIGFVAAAPARAEEVGRYQLFQGNYPFINLKGEGFRENALFKIDTATGKTWVARSSQVCPQPRSCVQVTRWFEFEAEIRISPP